MKAYLPASGWSRIGQRARGMFNLNDSRWGRGDDKPGEEGKPDHGSRDDDPPELPPPRTTATTAALGARVRNRVRPTSTSCGVTSTASSAVCSAAAAAVAVAAMAAAPAAVAFSRT